ncbi:MAG: RagB/SusD family nutrient uptake outer membrane protein [Muribaculaceae bacterium]|nr:RagB/SusD family nutrient uptake outer membrane protein [Muribaculaceae bacterium]
MSYNRIKTTFAGVALAMGAMFTGCDSLDIENMTSYDENTVWADPNLTKAYVNNLYTLCFGNWSPGADNNSEQITGIPWYLGTITETGGSYKSWDYTSIRQINEAIVRLEDNNVLSKNVADQMLGESLFMRAYKYYNMVIYHGGVPYLKVPQNKDTDDLYVKRNSTKECFQFMIEDLDKAISLLPAKSKGNDYGRIDGVFARAFKAKVLLLKCSPQFNPSNQWDNQYWQEAYTAAKEAYDFAVANGSQLTKNYSEIWSVEQGPEVIFPVINSNPNKTSTYLGNTRPISVSRSTNSSNPTWEFVKSVPMADGKMFDDPTGKYYVATEQEFAQKFWENRDPRFYEVCLYNGADFPVAEKPSNYRQYNALGLVDKDDAYGVNPAASVNATNNDVYSGFYNYKGHDNSLTQANVLTYDIDYQLMRFPEVMFIYAEAANETGHSDVAIDMLKQIRKRAGIEAGNDDLYGMKVGSREEVRAAILAERNVELCFEGHRFWDLRRTRNMMQLNGQTKHGLEAIAINPDGTDMDLTEAYDKVRANEMAPGDFRYVIHQIPYNAAAEREFVIEETFYFFPIQYSNITQNPNLEQNNNWGGTFNPTME